jgi:hypothetical protein
MSSPVSTPVYPVNESQSFLSGMIGSTAKKSNFGKTLPSQSVNFGNLMSRMSNDNMRNSANRSILTMQDARKLSISCFIRF